MKLNEKAIILKKNIITNNNSINNNNKKFHNFPFSSILKRYMGFNFKYDSKLLAIFSKGRCTRGMF